MKYRPADLEARTQREKDTWNDDQIVVAQGFKRRIAAAFDNPHGRKLESERDNVIRQRCPGATVLDYGCYEGYETRKYLDYGASHVCGIDISNEAIDRARAGSCGEKAEFLVADAHHLPFEREFFDLVVGRAILHHLELRTAYLELARVLKPGGLALFVEPLRGNPLSKLVRLLTPKARTRDELPLDYRDIRLGDELIGRGSHSYSGFISAPVGAAVSLLGGRDDNWLMRAACVGDDAIGNTGLKYWGRVAYLSFQKR